MSQTLTFIFKIPNLLYSSSAFAVLSLLLSFLAHKSFADENKNDLAQSRPIAAESSSANLPMVDKKLLMGYLADNSTISLVDARSAEEYAGGHVTGAVNIPHDQYAQLKNKLPSDHNRPIVIYCKSGKRATHLKNTLINEGYSNVQVLPPRQLFVSSDLMVFNCGVTE